MADPMPKGRRSGKGAARNSAPRVPRRAQTAPTRSPRARSLTNPVPQSVDVQAAQRLLLAVSRAQALFIEEATPKAVFGALLQELLTLTDSDYGFIGEVARTTEGLPFLRTHAITDIAWNEETKALMAQYAPTLEFRNLKTLFGHVMTTGQPVIANDPAHDPRAGGLPPGHPPMHAFLGVPLYRGDELRGMVGVANRPGGYDDALVTYLEPFLATCAQLLEGYHYRQRRAEAEAALRESEERWQLAMRGSHDGIWDWNIATGRVFFSVRWKQMRGYAEPELTDSLTEWIDSIHPEDVVWVKQALDAYLTQRAPEFREEYRVRRKDGSYIWVLDRGVAQWDSQGVAVRMAGSESDITTRKQEEALQAAEKQALELVARGAGLPEVLTFICRTIESQTAPMLTAIMLVTEDGQHLRGVAAPSLPEDYNRAVDGIPIVPTVGSCGSAAYSGKPAIVVDIEQDPLWKDYRHVAQAHGLRACWSQPILSSTGTVLGTFAAYYTEPRTPSSAELAVVERAGHLAALAIQHSKMGEALRESEARFHAFMTYSPAVSFIKDTAGRHLYINPTFERLFGLSSEELHGKTLEGRLPPEVVTQLQANDEKVLTSGQPIEVEETVPTPDGKSQQWLVLKFPLTAASGERSLGGMAIDITERKQAEANLRRTQFAMDQAVDAVYWIDSRARILYTNKAAGEMLGYTADEFLRMTVHDLNPNFPPEVWPRFWAETREKKVVSLETVHLTKDGRQIPIDIRVSFLAYGDQEFHCAFVRDITERKRAQDALDALVRGTGPVTGKAFFPVFVRELAQALHMKYAAVTDLLSNQPGVVSVRAMWCASPMDQPFTYLLAGTPCEVAIREGLICYPSGVQSLFPNDPDLVTLHAESYLGILLRNQSGMALGHIFVIDEKPLADPTQATAILHVFAARAAAELERLKADEALRASQERFELAVRATNDGIWDWNILTGEQYWSTRHFELFGLEPQAFTPTYETWMLLVHPDDADRVHQATCRHLETRTPYDIEARVRMKDGSYRWFHDQGQAVWDATGRPLRMVGSISDVTERKIAEEMLWAAHAELEQRVVERTAALRRSEQRAAALVNSVDGIIMEVDFDTFRITFVSQQAERILGYPVEQWLKDPMFWANHVHPDDRQWAITYCQGMAKQGLNHEFEYRMFARDGRLVWIRDAVSVSQDDDGRIKLYSILSDVTKHKDMVERLQLIQYAVDHAADQMFFIDSEGKIISANEAACQQLGYTREELLTKFVGEIDPDLSREVWRHHWDDLRVAKQSRVERIHRDKFGRMYSVEVTSHYQMYAGVEGEFASVRDITERKRNEAALLESEERFSKAFNESAIGMAITAPDGHWLQVNQALCEIVGYSKAELETMAFQSITHPDDLERDLHHVRQVLNGELRTYHLEKRYVHKNGSVIWIALNVSLVRNADGSPKHFISQIQDITERKRIEDKLRATQYAVDHASDQIFLIAPDGHFLDVNESACRRLGYSKEQLLTMSVMDIDPDHPREVWPKHWEEFRQAGQLRLETRHRTKDGEIYPVEITATYHVHNGQELDYAVARDMTERRLAEASIRESELRYKLLTEATFDGIAIHDQGILLEVNAGLERMFGYEPGELVGRSMWELIAEESRDLVLNNMQNNVNGPYEAMGRRKDGATFPGEVVVRPYRYHGKNVRLVAGRDITERKHLEAERRHHTEELERQVTERSAEIAQLESQRAQSEKLAAMGRLAAGVAHEINNPIAGIKNAFRLVRQAVNAAHPHAEFVDMIDREIARVASIVRQMYQLYRPESGKGEMVELSTMMQDIKALFSNQLQQRRLELSITVDSGLDWLCVPRRDLLQVLLNLLSNAIDCSLEGGRITLTICGEADVIRIAVSDQGQGIPPETLPHIFDPFFTTKTEGDQKGMGLGLSISQSLVTAMGGKIEVETQVNGGSTFAVLLPRHMCMARAQVQSNSVQQEVGTHDQ